MEPDILYEDSDIVVINKPAGFAAHATGRTDEVTVADWMVSRYPETALVGEPMVHGDGKVVHRPGIVHRLDRDTSGVMVLAKTQEAHAFLKQQFQSRLVKKEYRAFTYGVPKEKHDVIKRPIGRSPRDFRRWSAQPGARGELREAETEYEVLESLESAGEESFSYMALFPRTGRTHQIRVHLKAIHHPVVCDKLYARKLPCALGFSRLALHALRLTFELPSGGDTAIVAPPPIDFEEALALMQSRQTAQ